jgi:site-specific recombinase XerC
MRLPVPRRCRRPPALSTQSTTTALDERQASLQPSSSQEGSMDATTPTTPRPGDTPANKGRRYPADPPRVEEIVAVMRQAGDRPPGRRITALITVLWRAGLRISEALGLAETDLEPVAGSLLIRHGKGGKRRMVGMDEWGWAQLQPWLETRKSLPIGPLFCVISGPTAGVPWGPSQVRSQLRRLALRASVRRRFAPHQLRHAHAVEMARGRRASKRHPAPARSYQPGGDLGLPAGDR